MRPWIKFQLNLGNSLGWSTWLDSYGFNSDATRELKDIFGKKPFDTPKPVALIRWLVSLHADDDALVLDSFAGSGTTGHAALQLNKEDGGNRKFILVEMDENICQNVTDQRLKKVIEGYTVKKGDKETVVAGLGGGFSYCRLAEPLFDENGSISKDVSFSDLASHVFFTETGIPLPKRSVGKSPFIGENEGNAVYLLFNGILGDKRPDGGNILTQDVLRRLPPYNGPKIIFGEGCRLGEARLKKEAITFRQIPYEIRVG